MKVITNVQPTDHETDFLRQFESYSRAASINSDVEGEWRWANDIAIALLAEHVIVKANSVNSGGYN